MGKLFHTHLPISNHRPAWLRLALLALGIAALAGLGTLIGRGAALVQPLDVVSQAMPASPAVLPAPAATAQEPYVTAAPSFEAVPTALITPSATPSPTDAPIASRWPILLNEGFDRESAGWPALREPDWAAAYRDGGYELRLIRRPGISYSGPLRARDFWLAADVRIERGQAGLFFLRGKPNDFYRFLIDSDGRFRLEWQQVGASRALIDWTASDAIRRGYGAANQLAVLRDGDKLTLFANGERLAGYALPQNTVLEGRAGLALDAPPGERAGAALFDNLIARAPK